MSKLLTAEQLGEIRDYVAAQDMPELDHAESLIEHIDALEARLELTPESMGHDGIYARDETIRLQDKRIEELEGVLEKIEPYSVHKDPCEYGTVLSEGMIHTQCICGLQAILEQVKD